MLIHEKDGVYHIALSPVEAGDLSQTISCCVASFRSKAAEQLAVALQTISWGTGEGSLPVSVTPPGFLGT